MNLKKNIKNPFDSGYYRSEELKKFGFKKVGKDVQIAKNCTIVGLKNISLGNSIRIDSNVVIVANKGYLRLGDHVHVGAGSYLGCGGGITLSNFSGLSQSTHIYSASGDFSGRSFSHPTVDKKYQIIDAAPVILKEHVITGAGSVIMPGVSIGKGSIIGALSFVPKSIEEWGIYFGAPVKKINVRSKNILEIEKKIRKK